MLRKNITPSTTYSLLLFLALVLSLQAASIYPTFFTSISADAIETGQLVLGLSTPTTLSTNTSIASQTTVMTYVNSYSSTPGFGYGWTYLNSNWNSTTSAMQTMIDLSVTVATSMTTLKLNFTSGLLTQLSINYIVTKSNSQFFMDFTTTYIDFTSNTSIFSTTQTTTRTLTLTLAYKYKSNSSNTIAIYNTVGISMLKASNTFEFSLSTLSYESSSMSVTLTIPAKNGLRFIRFITINYESIVNTVSAPYYLDMGFRTTMAGSVPDSSGVTVSDYGSVMMGMTDWALSDTNAILNYNMSISGVAFSLTSSTVTRTRSSYLWYRLLGCPTYYFTDGLMCTACHYSCLSCFDATSNGCLSCLAANNRTYTSANRSCGCISQNKETGVAQCEYINCYTYCSGCSDHYICTGCSTLARRTFVNGSCLCTNYVLDVGLDSCVPCSPSCLTCSEYNKQTACLTCDSAKDHRTFASTNNTCACENGYYNPTNYLNFTVYTSGVPCLQCQYSCKTCTNSTACVDCNPTLGRVYSSATKLCICSDGYYDGGLKQACLTCYYTCLTCSANSTCLSCSSTRTLSGTTCPCTAGSYDVGVADCQPCNYSCLTCNNGSVCTTCSSSYFRTMSNGSCVCMSGYFDIGSAACNQCDPTCASCTTSAVNSCTSCSSAAQRELTSNNTCLCKIGYYSTGDVVCLSCYYACQSCSAAGNTSCLTCNATKYRTLSSSSCVCTAKYYDDGGNQLCLACLYYCLTCSSSSSCLTCDSATRSTTNLATCPCLTGFYDNLISSSCQPCQSTCLTCSNPNNCTSCPTGRTLTAQQTCVCSSRTFQPLCVACSYSCLSCSLTNTNCTSCNGSALRYLNATTSQCLCYSGYYDGGSSEQCLGCHYSCLTCTAGTACTSCPVNRVSNGSLCACISTYYENSNLNCLACHYSCASCSAYSTCTTCNATLYRTTSTNTSLCVCSAPYYDNGNSQLCFACDPTCASCSAYSTCTSCTSSAHFYLSNTSCLCAAGYYLSGSSCLACHYSCLTCDNGTGCLSCSPNRTLVAGSTCSCTSGLFDNPSTHICDSCQYPCTSCTNVSTTCTACDTSVRSLDTLLNKCICIGSTYDTGLNCTACLSTCQSCTNGTACVSCLSGSLRQLDSSGLCVCATGYHDQNGTVTTCQLCHYSCVTCANSNSCLTCYSGRIAVVGSTCTCPTTYYYDNGNSGQCVSCSYRCLSCAVVSTNCTACNSTTYRELTNSSNIYTCSCKTSYFDDGSTTLCQTCHYSCLTCGSLTACSTCNATNLRVYVSGPYCSCQAGYYDVTNVQLCQPCNYACLTCSSTSTLCLTCPTTRTLNTTSCPCSAGYFDAGVATCTACPVQCLTCSSSTACLSCVGTRQLDSLMQCVCLGGYYEVNQTNCLACSPRCQLCSAYSTCTVCATSTTFRELNASDCVCPAAYYDAATTNYTCQRCPYSCATCVSSSRCTSCEINYQRTYSLATTLCTCAAGYYDDTANAPCIACPYDCLTCSNAVTCLTCSTDRSLGSDNRCKCLSSMYSNGTSCEVCPIECSTCLNSSYCTACNSNRVLVANACVCSTGFFAVAGVATCSACLYSCLTCVTGTQCASCNTTSLRFQTGTSCLCQVAYYDDLSHQLCLSCHYSCLTCSNGTACLTCSSSNNRVYNSGTRLCDCVSGYYEDATKICVQCPYNCLTCSSSTVCTSCNPTFSRQLNATTNLCDCPVIGYYDTNISPVCATCHYTCLSCVTASTTCTACNTTTQRSLSSTTCPCSSGYYDVVNQVVCQACSYRCVTCLGNSGNCTLCSLANYRNATPACACLSGFYDDGSNALCQPCSYVCETCINSLTCSTCNLTVSHRALNNFTTLCDCIAQFYDSGSTICTSCGYSCLTCNHPTQCLTCPSTRTLTLSACPCLPKYYDDLASLNCLACHYSCQTCTSASACFSCNSAAMRVYNSTSLLCSCMTGYFDNGNETCVRCHLSCLTCLDANSCATCPLGTNKTLNATAGSYCVCLYGYYQNATAGALMGYNSICYACYYACETCFGIPTNCTLCNSTANRYLTTLKTCLCLTGYFEVANQQLCLTCYPGCPTCFGTLANNCLTCNSTTYFLNSSCLTSCPSYYANTTTPMRTCVSCPSNCLSCPTSTLVCQQCASTYFIFAYNSSYSICTQTCPNYYYELNYTCLPCVTPCVFCTAAYTCTTCIPLYYLKSGSCFPCQATCLTCSGPTALDCLTCQPDYILRNGVCQKMTCGSSQYVHSTRGCVSCSSSFTNSATCLSTGPTSCNDGYVLTNSSCLSCSQISGYTYDSTTGKCKDYCGDGKIITDSCDDGNTVNGDGCSSFCTVEDYWTCPNNICTLSVTPVLTLVSTSNNPSKHAISVIVKLSVGVRLVSKNFILAFTSITKFSYTVTALNTQYTMFKLEIVYYESPNNDKLSINVKSPVSRLLQNQNVVVEGEGAELDEFGHDRLLQSLTLSISLSLSISLPINTSPPAIYLSTEETQVYTRYLFGLVAALHIAVLIAIVVVLCMKLKVMLLIVDALNSLTTLYILGGLGMYGVGLVSHEAMRGLQPFVYPFGQTLLDTSTNFAYMDYTSLFFSSSGIQFAIIIVSLVVGFFETQSRWSYIGRGFVFAFAYDVFLSCFGTFFWSSYSSFQSSYSWMFALLSLLYLIHEGINYYRSMDTVASTKKVVPAISFITNDLENKEKSKQEINIFEFQEESAKEKKITKVNMPSELSDQKTEVDGQADPQVVTTTSYYDLTPSNQTHYSMSHSNHIRAVYLPVSSILFAIVYTVIANIQVIVLRSALLFAATVIHFIFVLASKNQAARSIRMIKLYILGVLYIAISIIVLVSAVLQQTINLKATDAALIALICVAITANLITFVINVKLSEAYREYVINKKNEEIIERNKKMNETRQKLYYKEPQQQTKTSSLGKNKNEPASEPPSQDAIEQPEIQISEEQVEEKELKFSQLKNKLPPRQMQSRTFIRPDTSSMVGRQIDDEFSQNKEEHMGYNRELLDEKNIFDDLHSSQSRKKSPDKSRQGNRIRAINNSEMSLVSKKGETPSLFLDHTLERIEEFKGVRKNVGKSKEKEEVPDTNKRMKKKKKVVREVDHIESDEEKGQYDVPRGIAISMRKEEEKPSRKISDNFDSVLDDMDSMPGGLRGQIKKKESGDRSMPAKMVALSEISSIRQEREQFLDQGIDQNSDGVSVFNKILQDYKIYKHKKIDPKKLKKMKIKDDI